MIAPSGWLAALTVLVAVLVVAEALEAWALWHVAQEVAKMRRRAEGELGELRRQLAAVLERIGGAAGEAEGAAREVGRLAEAATSVLQGAAGAMAVRRLLPTAASGSASLAQALVGLGLGLWDAWGRRRKRSGAT